MGFFSRRKPDVRFNLLVILMLVQAGWSRTDYRMHRRGLEGLTKLLVVKSNDSERANHVCGQYGYSFIRRVFDDENYYLFQRDDAGRPTLERLGRHPEIEWVSGQSVKRRVRRFSLRRKSSIQRGLLLSELLKSESPSNATPTFNDPLFTQQWYLHNSGQTGSPPRNDINVLPVWQLGITGRGVAIEVLDDGVHAQSEEVAANYESTLSEEYLFRKRSLQPIPENSHGTRCAAVAAGVANNGVCGVGVAYEAKIGGVRLLDGDLTDVQEALALVHALDRVDIYTASWGPMDKGRAVDGPQTLARLAFQKGVTTGRHGKGSIYVWAAGNGGGYHDNCSVDGYASNPYTLTIGALTEDGRSAFYSEPCPAVIAATYVGGREHRPPTHREWEVDRERVKVVVPAGRGKCQSTFQGTSAAAPMAAGIVALALQANPDLTWRDVRHLIIRTSRVPTPPERGWTRNAAGFHFHPQMGSGALDAHALVRMAREWTPVGELKVWTTRPRITTRFLRVTGGYLRPFPELGRPDLSTMSIPAALWFVAMVTGCCLAQPEYTTPGGILTTNCMKGCTEIVVHESNCYPPCDIHRYERCVLVPRHPEPSCPYAPSAKTSAALTEQKRAYACRCHPCLFRSHTGMCVPVCPTSVEIEA